MHPPTHGKQMRSLLFLLALLPCSLSLAGEQIPLPFPGAYKSPDSTAWQQMPSNEWRAIPQDVDMLISHEGDIIQLTVHISVYADTEVDITRDRTIINQMWLVSKPPAQARRESGRVDFDVYKFSSAANRFEDLGDGYCRPLECRYSYVTDKQQQRYDSHITWDKEQTGQKFKQSGGLSTRAAGKSEWKMFKKWDNDFSRKGVTVRF